MIYLIVLSSENIDETEKSDLPSVDAKILNENDEEKTENVAVTNDVTAVSSDDSKEINTIETAVETTPAPATTVDDTS